MGSREKKDSFAVGSNSSSSCSSPRGKDNWSQEVLMRSGGGLQGLIWSKYGIEHGEVSPLEKRRRQRLGRRVNSEPSNDIKAVKKKYTPDKGEQRLRSQSVPAEPNDVGKRDDIEIVDVLSKVKISPTASLEAPASGSNSPRSPMHYIKVRIQFLSQLLLAKRLTRPFLLLSSALSVEKR